MNRRHALIGFAAMTLCPLCSSAASAAEAAHWSYEGSTGPDKWGALADADKVCAVGNQQSPIDITTAIKADLPKIEIAWGGGVDSIVNNGHTIQLNVGEGSTLAVGGEKYRLVQFHFHRPSEHKVDGKGFPMEVHFVHATASGALGVVGVLMTAGKPNAAFNKIVATMPTKEGPAVKADAAINPNGLLPPGRGYYNYEGSLTTPPCAETVSWMLLTDPIEVAEADIAAFGKLYTMNARPPQKVNRRFVLRS
jgi:carbonic anhydrase